VLVHHEVGLQFRCTVDDLVGGLPDLRAEFDAGSLGTRPKLSAAASSAPHGPIRREAPRSALPDLQTPARG